MSDTLSTPIINFSTGVLTSDLLRTHFQSLATYLRQSTQLLSGYGYGIVDPQDPTTNPDNLVKSLWVAAADTTNYTVLPGIAVAPSGDIMFQDASVSVGLVDLSGGLNVIVLQYSVVDSAARSLTTSNQMVSNGQEFVSSTSCMTEQAYLALPFEQRQRCVVLAGVIYASTGNTLLTAPTTQRPWLRKWFSFNDIEHRSHVGSGTVTATNPHGTGVGDLTVGDVKFYDQFTGSGLVVSKDVSVSGVPGYFCSDVFTSDDVKIDFTGEITSRSFFGGTHVRYVELSSVPCQILSAYDTALELPISVDWIPGTRIVVLYLTVVPTTLSLSYTKSPSCSVSSTTSSSVNFAGMSSNELVISAGVQVKTLAQTSFPIRRFAGIPRAFNIYLDGTGFLVGDPSVLVPSQTLLGKTGVELLAATVVPDVQSYVGIGMHNAGFTPTMSVVVTVTGILPDGSTNVETITLNQTTYADVPVPPAMSENDQQVLFTQKSYTSITSVKATSVVDISSSCTFIVYTKLDPARHRFALLASGLWNGREAQDITDKRRVLPVVRDGVYGITALTAAAEVVVGANELISGTGSNALTVQNYKHVSLICAEDFNEPRYLDAVSVLWEGRSILDCAVIDKAQRDSSMYKSCYRSRLIPIRKYEAELCGFVVILNSADTSVIQEGCVRVVMKNDALDIVECVLKPMQGDLSGRIWIGYTSVNYRSAGFVISGRCSGFAAYFVNSANINVNYSVQTYARS